MQEQQCVISVLEFFKRHELNYYQKNGDLAIILMLYKHS